MAYLRSHPQQANGEEKRGYPQSTAVGRDGRGEILAIALLLVQEMLLQRMTP
jgi:hypothetical protein